MEEHRSSIKHGGREKTSFPLVNLPQNRCCSNRGASRSCKRKCPKDCKTREGGKNFHSHTGIYLKISAAAIVATVATASGRAPKYYKTRGGREQFHFHSKNLPPNRCCSNRGASRSYKWKRQKVVQNTGRGKLSLSLENLLQDRCCSNRGAGRSSKWKSQKVS